MWHDKIQNVYNSFDEFKKYDEIYGLFDRINRSGNWRTLRQMWNDNPVIQGGTNPANFGLYKGKTKVLNPAKLPRKNIWIKQAILGMIAHSKNTNQPLMERSWIKELKKYYPKLYRKIYKGKKKNPLTTSGKRIKKGMQKRYGKWGGSKVFYATMKKKPLQTKKWHNPAKASGYIDKHKIDVYDNGGKTLDRYTVVIDNEYVFGMSYNAVAYNEFVGEMSRTYAQSGRGGFGKKLKSIPFDIVWAIKEKLVNWAIKKKLVLIKKNPCGTKRKRKNPIKMKMYDKIKINDYVLVLYGSYYKNRIGKVVDITPNKIHLKFNNNETGFVSKMSVVKVDKKKNPCKTKNPASSGVRFNLPTRKGKLYTYFLGDLHEVEFVTQKNGEATKVIIKGKPTAKVIATEDKATIIIHPVNVRSII